VGRLCPRQGFVVFVACIAGVVFATIGSAAAGARDKPVPPERWVRGVCSSWSDYADDDIIAARAVEGILNNLKSGELKPKKARERLVRLQRTRVDGIDRVVRAVQKSDVPTLENGAAIRQAYLDTVKEYRTVETQKLAQYRKLETGSAEEVRVAVQEAETRRADDIRTIGYDPLEELKAAPVLATAIDGAATCQEVADWLDLSGLSDVAVGQCMTLGGNATLESFRLVDTDNVDCAEPHVLEVFLQTQHPAAVGEPYPGDPALQAFAEEQCTGAFAGYVGRDFDSSSLDAYWTYPDDQGWKANDRELLCMVALPGGGPVTGSARGSGQ
jgi:Septum formation